MQKVYTKIESIVGNVVTVRASGVRSGDLALVGESYANVIKLDRDLVTLQVFSGTQGVSTTDPVRFLGRPMMVSFSDHLLGRIFNGAGDTRLPFLYSLIGMWGIRILGTFLCVHVFHLGLNAVWLCMVGDNVCRGILLALRFRKKGLSHTIPA